MGNTVTYRLKDKNHLGSWSIKDGAVMRGGVLESVHYRPGATSIFDSDNEKSKIQPAWVTFSNNENPEDPACEIVVPKSNGLLIEFLESIAFYGTVYEKYDPELKYLKKAANFDNIQKALGFISQSDSIKTKATAIAVFGLEYFHHSNTKCEADLKEEAVKNSENIIQKMEDSTYESRFLAAMAYCNNILCSNETMTAIHWADGGGKILGIAPGEDPIQKLTEYFQSGTEASTTLIQEIGSRLNNSHPKHLDSNSELEEMRKRLEAIEAEKEQWKKIAQSNSENTKAEEKSSEEDNAEDETVNSDDEKSLEEQLAEAHLKFEELLEKKVPANMKNNLNWILGQIEKAQ